MVYAEWVDGSAGHNRSYTGSLRGHVVVHLLEWELSWSSRYGTVRLWWGGGRTVQECRESCDTAALMYALGMLAATLAQWGAEIDAVLAGDYRRARETERRIREAPPDPDESDEQRRARVAAAVAATHAAAEAVARGWPDAGTGAARGER